MERSPPAEPYSAGCQQVNVQQLSDSALAEYKQMLERMLAFDGAAGRGGGKEMTLAK